MKSKLEEGLESVKKRRRAMISEHLNIPESVANFIQGHVPKSIGAKHYMRLKRKADQFYPRYAEYVTELRRKARILEYTHTMLRDVKRLYEKVPEPLAWIHPETANKYGIIHEKPVVVKTKRGSIRLKAKVTADIMPNVIYIPHGWLQANVNLLTDDEARDPISGFPSLKSLLCKITPVV